MAIYTEDGWGLMVRQPQQTEIEKHNNYLQNN